MEEIFNTPTSGIGVRITNGGTPVSAGRVTVNVELLNEQTLVRNRQQLSLAKGLSDGFFIVQFKRFFSDDLQAGNFYSYCISSGSDTIDTISGRFKVKEEASLNSLSRQIETFKRQQQQQINSMKESMKSEQGIQRQIT